MTLTSRTRGAIPLENSTLVTDAQWMVSILSALFDIPVKVVIKNKGRCHYQMMGGQHCITLSAKVLADHAELGYQEYKSLRYLVHGNPRGTEVAKWIAVHEFAHVLVAKNMPIRGDMHGKVFQGYYKTLIDFVF